jgi:hypothetical protein
MTEPPPDQPQEPPPDQPHEPPPDQPEKPRQSRRWWISGAAVIVVVAIAAVAFILAPTGGSSDPHRNGQSSVDAGGSSDPDRYGQNAVDVVHELHICDNPQVDQGIATCTLPDGIGYAVVVTVDDKAEAHLFASGANDPGMGCSMVVKGYLVTGPDRDTLTDALGNLEAFAAKHHGYLVGDCG